MQKTTFLQLLILILWLPFLGIPIFWAFHLPPALFGYRAGRLAFLPLLGLTLGICWQTFEAVFYYKTNIVIPNDRYLDALKRISRGNQVTALFLPIFGMVSLLLLVPQYAQATFSVANGGLPESFLQFPCLTVPTLEHPISGAISVLFVCIFFSLFVWRKLICALLFVLFLLGAFFFDPLTRDILFLYGNRLFVPALLYLFVWLLLLWGWKWLRYSSGASDAAQLSSYLIVCLLLIGLVFSLFPQAHLQMLLANAFPWLLFAQLVWVSVRSYQEVKLIVQETQCERLQGVGAYLFGGVWPASVGFAWLGWLFWGGSRFGGTLQYEIFPLFSLAGSYLLCFGAFSLLQNLHTTALQPPNKIWLFFRPIMLYLGLLLPFGMPAFALIKSISW